MQEAHNEYIPGTVITLPDDTITSGRLVIARSRRKPPKLLFDFVHFSRVVPNSETTTIAKQLLWLCDCKTYQKQELNMEMEMVDPTTVIGTPVEHSAQYAQVLCCVCGIPMAPNLANTCATCLASTSDITRGISTESALHQCRSCQRWHKEAGKWISCELESRELMSLCLSNISGLKSTKSNEQRIRLIDATWIWTEPHSMRLKVRLTVQKEVQSGTILQQAFTVVFVVRNQQCIECQSEFRQGSWKSLVQVRQRVAHKRTFLYLEQLILKHGAHRGCLNVETFGDGMDFYFPDKGKANRFISFLEDVVPTKVSRQA
jgi:nonsense-mediated mRNA decay protein 3